MEEKRLIDADKIYDAIERRYQVSSGIEHRCERDFLDLICASDTVDAVEVVHGRWIQDKQSKFEHRYNCSACNYRLIDEHCNYCPNCGAKMDLEV